MPLMLHPITISVNFCGPIRIAAEVRQQRGSHRLSVQQGKLQPEPHFKSCHKNLYFVESESSLKIKEDREN